ncbi:unnamed protein product [Peronospora farinosa]|uniref:BZIP domain-containing protein n=1 Tax=Peronospora farinosa TaxID=134698 RepID=A0AAV0UV76_9STRA|nr:unnamed protein product [Peronospora farinosa]CAI5740188.1 unnamed protein product [Peronospora farinosa]
MKIVATPYQNTEIMDEDLIEALGYFSDDVQIPIVMSTKLEGSDIIDSLLLSLEIQELFSSDEEERVKKENVCTNVAMSKPFVEKETREHLVVKPKDRRQRPFSTSKRHNRRRPKDELAYLRAKVVELQDMLVTVGNTEMSLDDKNTALAMIKTTSGLSSWKETAERQKHEVAISLNENRKLRNRLLGQLQVTRVLEAAIQQYQTDKATSIHDLLTSAFICKVTRPLVMNVAEEEIFAHLDSQLETQLAEVNGVLTTHGLSSVRFKLQGGFKFNREENGISFRHEEARLLPFSLQELHYAIWNSMHNGLVVNDTETQVLNNDRYNLIIRDTIELSKSHHVTITKRAAFRRHIEQDCVVFVWCSYVQIEGSISLRLLEKGWSTASTFELHRGVIPGDSSSKNFTRGCITRMAIQLIPEISKYKSEQEAQMHIGGMTDLIDGAYQHNFNQVNKFVERLLTNDEPDDNDEGFVPELCVHT